MQILEDKGQPKHSLGSFKPVFIYSIQFTKGIARVPARRGGHLEGEFEFTCLGLGSHECAAYGFGVYPLEKMGLGINFDPYNY